MGRIIRTSLDQPDEVRELPLLTAHLARVGSLVVGRGTLQPGWHWSTHMRSVVGKPLCRVHHTQLRLSGSIAIQIEDGEYQLEA